MRRIVDTELCVVVGVSAKDHRIVQMSRDVFHVDHSFYDEHAALHFFGQVELRRRLLGPIFWLHEEGVGEDVGDVFCGELVVDEVEPLGEGELAADGPAVVVDAGDEGDVLADVPRHGEGGFGEHV